jgi:hypothetical protein
MKKADLIEAMLAKEVMSKIKDAPEVKPAPAPTKIEEPRTTKKGFGIKRMPKSTEIKKIPKVEDNVQVKFKGQESDGKNYVVEKATKTGFTLREIGIEGQPMFSKTLKTKDLENGESKILRYLTPKETGAKMKQFIKSYVERGPEPKAPHTLKRGETPYDEQLKDVKRRLSEYEKENQDKLGRKKVPKGFADLLEEDNELKDKIKIYKKFGVKVDSSDAGAISRIPAGLPTRDNFVSDKAVAGRRAFGVKDANIFANTFANIVERMKKNRATAEAFYFMRKPLIEEVMKAKGVNLARVKEAMKPIVDVLKGYGIMK